MSKERIGSFILLLAGIYAFFSSLQFSLGKLTQPGPGMFPLILSVLLCIVAVLIFISGERGERIDWRGAIKQWGKPFKIVLLTIGFILAIERMGYLITAFLYLFGLFLWVCRFRWWVSVILSVILAPATWYFFGKILTLHLPTGRWGV